MSRPLNSIDVEVNTGEPQRERRLARSTARAFAAAISALLISTLVIHRSSDALEPDGTLAGNSFESGTIDLTDDDQGRSLFDLSAMVPGRGDERCLEIRYGGTIVPVDLTLLAHAAGDLADFLTVRLESGQGGRFDTCVGFVPDEIVYRGTLAELVDGGPLSLGRFLNGGDRRSFRVRFQLADTEEALGQLATADFVWEVTPT